MSDKPNTRVVSVVAQALLMDEKKPVLYNIYMDLLTSLKNHYPELWSSSISLDNSKGWDAFKAYKDILNGMLLSKVPGLVINGDINTNEAIKNANKSLGMPFEGFKEIDKINDIRFDLQTIIDKHCGTLKDLEQSR
jgi:hypothetical protein